MKINNKGGINWQALGAVLLVLIGAGVLFPTVLNIGGTLNKAEDKSCAFSLLMSSTTKVMGKELISPECEHKTYVIGKEIIEKSKQASMARQETSAELINKVAPGSDYIKKFGGGSDSEEWYLDEFMANELKKCWDNAGRGNYDLFDDWMSMLDCSTSSDTISKPCTNQNFMTTIWQSMKNSEKVPTFCILCSAVHFEKDIPQIANKDIDSLDDWLVNNPIPRTKTAYSDYLSKNTNVPDMRVLYSSYTTKESQAVVYIKKIKDSIFIGMISSVPKTIANPTSYISGALGLGSAEIKEDYVQYVDVLNYKDLENTCTMMIG